MKHFSVKKKGVSDLPVQESILDDILDYYHNNFPCKDCAGNNELKLNNHTLEVSESEGPVPGSYYSIKYTKVGLLELAGRAYQVGSGDSRLDYAKLINNHPLNRKFWIKPYDSFTKKYFQEGVISFRPIFTCEKEQKIAGRGEKKCFAKIWIPKIHDSDSCILDEIFGSSDMCEDRKIGFVHISSSGINDSPMKIFEFFKNYDSKVHLDLNIEFLKKFTGISNEQIKVFNENINKLVVGHLDKIKNSNFSKFILPSLNLIRNLDKRNQMPLAPAFVIGVREAGRRIYTFLPGKGQKFKKIIINGRTTGIGDTDGSFKGMLDTFWQSGLDNLFTKQIRLRSEGFLPVNLRFSKGKEFDKPNPEAVGKIKSAKIPYGQIFLAHCAEVSHAMLIFEEHALALGFAKSQIDSLQDLERNFWISLAFAGPCGSKHNPQNKYGKFDRKGPCGAYWKGNSFGVDTLLTFLIDKKMKLNDITKILSFRDFKHVNSSRTAKAIRAAVATASLEKMMREFFQK
jgi:hypothetical protein